MSLQVFLTCHSLPCVGLYSHKPSAAAPSLHPSGRGGSRGSVLPHNPSAARLSAQLSVLRALLAGVRATAGAGALAFGASTGGASAFGASAGTGAAGTTAAAARGVSSRRKA